MMLLSFAVGGERYGIEIRGVRAVMPLAPLRPLDLAPAWAVGVLEIFDRLVPVVDLSRLHGEGSSRRAYSTRVVLVDYAVPGGSPRMLGLVAEEMTDVVDVDAADFRDSGVVQTEAPWLGPLAPDDTGTLLQVVDVERLLPEDVRSRLFAS